MLITRDKKILVYLFLFIFLGTTNNKYFTRAELFTIKNLNLYGLDDKEKNSLLQQLDNLKNQSLFSISEKKLTEILNSNNIIESFLIKKNYPSALDIIISKTSFLANMNIGEEKFFIGSNKKLIKTDQINTNLPIVLGNPKVEDFFLIKNIILDSPVELSEISILKFYKSKRWDIRLKSGILIKLPITNTPKALNDYFQVINLPQFKNVKIFDMRINNQIIINEL